MKEIVAVLDVAPVDSHQRLLFHHSQISNRKLPRDPQQDLGDRRIRDSFTLALPVFGMSADTRDWETLAKSK
jgi:hypothetical protein